MFDSFPDVLTVAQVRQALSLGKNSVYELIDAGRLKSIHIGRKILVPKVCLIEFVNGALLDSGAKEEYNDNSIAAGETDAVRKE